MDLAGKNADISIGSTIDFTFGGNAIHVFDKNTGKNLEF